MSHRTRRSVVDMLPLLCLFALIGVGSSSAAAQETDDLILAIEDVESFARTSSPRLRTAAYEVDVVAAERTSALTWSNPALAYDHEENDAFREWQFTLNKRIDRPLTRGRLSDAWDGRVRAAELRSLQAARDVVADLKTGYVQVRLIESHQGRLDRLAGLVDIAADVARSRHVEGELSGLDRRLIQLAAYTIETAENRARAQHERMLALWRADMGVPASRSLVLSTPVAFRPVDLQDIGTYQGSLQSMPGDQAQVELARALEVQADAARPRLVPGLEVYGGYKRLEPDLDGFVAGVALDLPLSGQGRGEAARLRAERLIVESALTADRARREGEIAALVASLSESQSLLAEFAADFDQNSLADALSISYREGAITLDELLGAIQIEAAAMDAHYADLATYYDNIFRLEALTGAKLVNFAPY
ncbi:MAG: TolC family protein [Candidatus Krumholzibacteriia bacterium]